MTELLRMNLLGGLSLTLGDETMGRFVSSKAPALLSYLAYTGQSHTRASLTGLLWGESPEAQAKASLRQVLTDLRRNFAAHLLIERDAVTFNQQAPHWLDVGEFIRRFQSATTGHGEEDDILTDVQAAALQVAADLYRGDFLAGFYVPTAPAFEEWVTGEQEWLRQAALQALHRLTAYYSAHGSYLQGINAAGRLLALEPWQEEAHRQLMLLLALSGQRAAALAQFETCRRLLAKDLGVNPTSSTVELFEQIRAGEIAPELNVSTVTLSSPAPNNLPAQATSFIGRETELTQIVTSLLGHEHRVWTITGAGGIGKTRLALAAAERASRGYPHGIWFVPLADLFTTGPRDADLDVQLLVDGIGEALKLTFSCPAEPAQQLIEHLRPMRALLVLDALKHAPPAAFAFLRTLLESAEDVCLLITAQAPIGLPGEEVLRLDGLPVPDSPEEPCAAKCDGVRLFLERADRTAGGYRPGPEQQLAIAEIVHLLGGSPLGIELAASWVRHWAPVDILDALKKQTAPYGARGAIPTVDVAPGLVAAFDGCWDLLPPAHRECLANLVVFSGEFSEAAATAVTGAQSELLSGLVERFLLQSPAPERFALHRLIRQLTRRRLETSGPSDALSDLAQDRHSFYYLNFLSQREAALQKRQMPQALTEIQKEWRNIQRAWHWAAMQGNSERLQHTVNALSRYLYLRGLCQVGERMFAEAATALETQPWWDEANLRPVEALFREFCRGQLLLGEARFLNLQSDCMRLNQVSQEARRRFEDALHKARALELPNVAVGCLSNLGSVSVLLSDYVAAQQHLEAALALAEELDEPAYQVNVLSDLGVVMMLYGDYATAFHYLERCQETCRNNGNRAGEGLASYNLGIVADTVGWYDAAAASYEHALRISREIGDERLEAQTLASQGLLFYHCGDHDAAWEISHKAARLAEAGGHRPIEAKALTNSGLALLHLGFAGEAATAFRQAVDIQRELGQMNLAMEPLAGLAEVAVAVGRVGQAMGHVEEILLHLAPEHNRSPLTLAGLKGANEPFRVCLTCVHVLEAGRSPRTREYRNRIYELLLQQADKISDRAMRRSYLERVPSHREILQVQGVRIAA